MTSSVNNFNDFPENQHTKFRAVLTVLRQIGTTRSSVQSKSLISFGYFDSRPLMSMNAACMAIEVGTFQWIQSSSIHDG